jgi:hypothetical protein
MSKVKVIPSMNLKGIGKVGVAVEVDAEVAADLVKNQMATYAEGQKAPKPAEPVLEVQKDKK